LYFVFLVPAPTTTDDDHNDDHDHSPLFPGERNHDYHDR
jgi:hypothetical protein